MSAVLRNAGRTHKVRVYQLQSLTLKNVLTKIYEGIHSPGSMPSPPHRSPLFSSLNSVSKIQSVFLFSSFAAVVFEFETRREPSVPFRMLLQVDGTQAFYVTECCERRWVVTSDGEGGSTSQRLGPVRTLSVQSTCASNVS